MKIPVGKGGRVFASSVICLTLLAVAACSSNASSGATSSASGGATSSAEVAAAQKRLAVELKAPSTLPYDKPLSKKPPTGKTAYYLQGNISSEQLLTQPFQEAAAALGWTAKIIPYTYGDPQSQNAALQQAVNQNANYIFLAGIAPDLAGPADKAALAKKIPIVTLSTDVTADPSVNDVYATIDDVTWNVQAATQLSDWAIANSGGDAHLLWVTYPDSTSLNATAPRFQSAFTGNCPTCTYNVLDVSTPDLTGGSVPGLVVSALQRDPKINYIQFAFGGLDMGVSQALKAAGMTSVKMSVVQPDATGMTDFGNGSINAVYMINQYASTWQAMDIFARLSIGDAIPTETSTITQIWTKANAPQSLPSNGNYVNPTDYQDQFKALWHVG
jgi:ribose transport system substrate-binding protein